MHKLAITAVTTFFVTTQTLNENSDEPVNDKHKSNGLIEDGDGDFYEKITEEIGRHQHLKLKEIDIIASTYVN